MGGARGGVEGGVSLKSLNLEPELLVLNNPRPSRRPGKGFSVYIHVTGSRTYME